MRAFVTTGFKALVALWALLLLLSTQTLATTIAWPEDKAQLINDVSQHPGQVIQTVKQILSEKKLSSLEQAQYHYILSDAYYASFLGPESLSEAKQALKLALANKDVLLQQVCRLKVARAYDQLPDPSLGLPYAQDVLVWSKQQEHQPIQIEAFLALGTIHLKLGNYTSALDAYINAYNLAQTVDDPRAAKAPYIAYFIGQVYEAQDKYDLAIPYFAESVEFDRQTGNKVEISNSLYELGLAYGKVNQLDKAVDYLSESMAISVELEDKQGTAYSTQALVDVLFASNDEHKIEQLKELMPLLDEAIESFSQGGNIVMQVQSLLTKAKWLQKNMHIDDAFRVLEKAEGLALAHNIYLQKGNILRLKAKLLAESGDYKGAFEASEAAREEEAFRRQEADDQKFRELRAGFELDQKEYENRLLAETNARQKAELVVSKRDQIIVFLVIAVLVVLFVAIVFMYVSVRRQHRKFKRLAQTDDLTGLYNRRQTLKLLEREKKLAVRQEQPLSVAIADLDDFKYINDTFGHQVGDEVLELIGERIRNSFRNTDIIGRIGGEEFLFVFPAAACGEVVSSLRQFMEDCKVLPESLQKYPDLKIRFSIGLVDAMDSESVTFTLAKADKLMYQAKEQGKNQVMLLP